MKLENSILSTLPLWAGASISIQQGNTPSITFDWLRASAFHSAAYSCIQSFVQLHGYKMRSFEGYEMVDYTFAPALAIDRTDDENCHFFVAFSDLSHCQDLLARLQKIRAEVYFSLRMRNKSGFGMWCAAHSVSATGSRMGDRFIAHAKVNPSQCRELRAYCIAASDGYHWLYDDDSPRCEFQELIEFRDEVLVDRRINAKRETVPHAIKLN